MNFYFDNIIAENIKNNCYISSRLLEKHANEDKTTNVQRYKISSISYDCIKLHLEFLERNYSALRQHPPTI